jgi:hypothetical protein
MKIDLTTEIQNLEEGKPFVSGSEMVQAEDDAGKLRTDERGNPIMVSKPIPLVMRDVLLGAFSEPDQKATWKEKIDRGSIAQRIHQAPRYIEFTSDQITTAKELISKTITAPVAIMRVCQLLDPVELDEDMRPVDESEDNAPPESPDESADENQAAEA